MAKIKNFSEQNGEAVELVRVWSMDNAPFAARFPGIKGFRSDGYSMWVGVPAGVLPSQANALPLLRKVEYKSNPSKHICDARCMNATGRIMKCECACGGRNHGKGGFRAEAA